jgi:uncharacterized protein YdeI (YjbR/CyaY-like superfamily)
MKLCRKRPATMPSARSQDSLKRAAEDLVDQTIKHHNETAIRQSLVEALERNHLAELMYQALSARR